MAVQPDDAPAQALPPGPRPATSRRLWVIVAIVAALLVVTAIVVVIDWMTGDDGVDRGRDRVVSGPRDGRDRATFALLDGTRSVTVRTRDLGDRLYRVETPPGGARVPRVAVVGDEVKLGFGDGGHDGLAATDVQLSSAVRWQIRILAGAAEQVIDLTGGKVAGVELAGGATRIELTLPPPEGTTTVRMSGGVGQWAVHQLGAAPVRVRVGSGAANVTVDAAQHNGVSGGTVLTPAGWDAARNRVDIDAVAGLSTLVVDRR